MNRQSRADVEAIWRVGVAAVQGDTTVRNALLADSPFEPDLVLSMGKAAANMCLGALDVLPNSPDAIVVVPIDSAVDALQNNPAVSVLHASHPVPDQSSLDAGRALSDAVRDLPGDSRLLVLVSGGASALAEDLAGPTSLQEYRRLTREWLASGLDIASINAERMRLSNLKGGKLLREFGGEALRVYAISDVRGDDIGVIGSGIGDPALAQCGGEAKVIATNEIARDAAAQYAVHRGYEVRVNEESLYGDVHEVAERVCATLGNGDPGAYIWGGEPVVTLPDGAGRGGRNQSLALAIALGIEGRPDIDVIAAGTDGIDGMSDAAGGIVNGVTVGDSGDAERHLDAADAGTWLARNDAAFVTGPTGTNVMDLVVAIIGTRGRA